MPIKIQSDLPAKAELEEENIFVMDENRRSEEHTSESSHLKLSRMPSSA